MTSTFKFFIAAGAMLALSGCADKPKSQLDNLPPGKYVTSTENTNSRGTDTSVKRTLNVGVDANGNKVGTVETKTTKDPEGFFNKSSNTTTKTVR